MAPGKTALMILAEGGKYDGAYALYQGDGLNVNLQDGVGLDGDMKV